jgi:NAD(P)-dependent dehydrogenase (short-subunit alcohol dehydrogenase family)
MAPLTIQPMEEIRAHFAVNTLGGIAVCQAFAPLLGQDRSRRGDPGRIVNITSMGGQIASPFLGAYTATKHAMESVTDSLRRELRMFGIDAISVGPGAVQTPIWKKAEKEDGPPYQDTPWADALANFLSSMVKSGEKGLPVERIAEVVEAALTDPRPKARYMPVPNKLTTYYVMKALPKRWLDRLFASRFDLDKPAS